MTDEQTNAISALINGNTGALAVVLSFLIDRDVIERDDLMEHLQAILSRCEAEMKDPRNALPLKHLLQMLRGEIPMLH